jgi:hypothetical protein
MGNEFDRRKSVMNIRRRPVLSTFAFLLLTSAALGQQGTSSRPGGPGAGQPPARPEDGPGGKRPRPPIETVLDANGDGIIDATEIANAPTALKKLDKNGDGRLTPDEYRPPRPGDASDPKKGRP